MEVWQVVVVPFVTAILVVLTRPLETLIARRRTGSVNSIRVIAEFMIRTCAKLDGNHALRKEVESWLQHPNAMGSEASMGVLIAKMCVATSPSRAEVRRIDRALNALDQRATERERSEKSSTQRNDG
jgi:hypothetical protein